MMRANVLGPARVISPASRTPSHTLTLSSFLWVKNVGNSSAGWFYLGVFHEVALEMSGRAVSSEGLTGAPGSPFPRWRP